MDKQILPFKVYTLAEAAELLKIDRNGVYRHQSEGSLPKKKVGKGYKFLGEDLLRFMGSASLSELTKTQ